MDIQRHYHVASPPPLHGPYTTEQSESWRRFPSFYGELACIMAMGWMATLLWDQFM